MTASDERERRHSAGAGTSRLEWCAAALGGGLFAAMIGFLVHVGLTAETGPPKVVVTQGAVEPGGQGFVLQFVARNDGLATAAAVKIKGRLTKGDQVVEEREAVLDYLPQGSEREGGLFFERDPGAHGISISAEGYARP